MRDAGVCVVDAAVDVAVDTMILIYSLPFPADSNPLAGGLDVRVVQAFRLQLPLMLS